MGYLHRHSFVNESYSLLKYFVHGLSFLWMRDLESSFPKCFFMYGLSVSYVFVRRPVCLAFQRVVLENCVSFSNPLFVCEWRSSQYPVSLFPALFSPLSLLMINNFAFDFTSNKYIQFYWNLSFYMPLPWNNILIDIFNSHNLTSLRK